MAKAEPNFVDSIAGLARGHRLRRVPLDWLWDAYLKKHLELDPLERRQLFLDAVRGWEQAGGCRLPQRPKDWRQDALPALPSWIQVLAKKSDQAVPPSPRQNARARSWTPLMQFMANRAVVPDLPTAIALDNYIRTRALDALPWVPAKERSVEIFGHGHEKKLERIAAGSTWFTSGGLTLATLRCFRVPRQPVHALFPEAKPGGIIISENEAGFHSLCRAASLGAGFHCVVFGDGSEVHRVVEFLREKSAELGCREVTYLGDVDRKGLEIATGLAELLAVHELRLVPWEKGYCALLDGITVTDQVRDSENHRKYIHWLPASLQSRALAVIATHGHQAQEVFGWTALARLWNLPESAGYIPPT